MISLLLWIPVKDYYGYAVTFTASRLIGGVRDLKLEEIAQQKDIIQATFSAPSSRKPDLLVDILVKTSLYTFNVPLTCGIMAALYLFIRRKRRAYAEALLILLCVHLVYVITFEGKMLREILTDVGIVPLSRPRIFMDQFLWGFTDNMLIRFEPFLIGFYLFIRFRKQKNLDAHGGLDRPYK
jgi:hypothetical protein